MGAYKNYVKNIISMIVKNNRTSLFNKLEKHRKIFDNVEFQSLLFSLITKLNDEDWCETVQRKSVEQRSKLSRSRKNTSQLPTWSEIKQCILILYYYIVCVINKSPTNDTIKIWEIILKSSETKIIAFYRFLYENDVDIPSAVCAACSEDLYQFFRRQTVKDQIKLILLGFTFDINTIVGPRHFIRIKDCEKLFIELQRKNLHKKKLHLQRLIPYLKTPEELSLFLSHFPDYDLNDVDQKTSNNMLDEIVRMKPYFYVAPEVTPDLIPNGYRGRGRTRNGFLRPRTIDSKNPDSYPNEITKYRASRLLTLFRSVILQGGKLSKPLYDDAMDLRLTDKRFLSTSIGLYALIGLRMDDIYPCECPEKRDIEFVLCIIQLMQIFETEFQEFILHHLASSYSIVHKADFRAEQRDIEDITLQDINDKLFQRPLSLKEWCRLKMKDLCSTKQIDELNLPNSLKNYCSFELLNSNYSFQCIRQVTLNGGDVMPKYEQLRLSAGGSEHDDDNDQFPIDDDDIVDEQYFNDENDFNVQD